jgi:hypothetical protein
MPILYTKLERKNIESMLNSTEDVSNVLKYKMTPRIFVF